MNDNYDLINIFYLLFCKMFGLIEKRVKRYGKFVIISEGYLIDEII